jgi:hypothetical protein
MPEPDPPGSSEPAAGVTRNLPVPVPQPSAAAPENG